MPLILASNSPRRRELLAQITENFLVVPSLYDESAKGLSARETVALFARKKAEEVASRFPADPVLGADTVVCLGERILGKPRGEEEACAMLRALSGREHSVYTGVCLINGASKREYIVGSKVFFYPLGEELIRAYVASGSPLDKAGAYGIQDGFPIVQRFEGSYTNIVGLPVEETRALLRSEGILC